MAARPTQLQTLQNIQSEGKQSPADLLTKHLNAENINNRLQFTNAEYREGRPDAAPIINDDEQILKEDTAWQHDEGLRNKVDENELELRLR